MIASSSGKVESVKYLVIAITRKFTLNQSGSTC